MPSPPDNSTAVMGWDPNSKISSNVSSADPALSITTSVIYLGDCASNVNFNKLVLLSVVYDLVSINFQINEGERYILTSLEILGNKIFTDSEIINLIDIKENEYYNPANIRKELKFLKYYYMTLGKKEIVLIDETEVVGNKVHLRITISEGKTFKISSMW